MKKLLSLTFLLAAMLSFYSSSFAQDKTITSSTQFYVYGTAKDTLDNAETKDYVIAGSPFITNARMFAKVTNVSGTSSIKVVMQGSWDKAYWIGLDSITVTSTVTRIKGATVSPYMPYIRLHLVGSGTQKSIPTVFISLQKQQ